MLNGRLYRAAFVPFLFALALAAFSLGPRPLPLTSTLAPDAFEGQPAFEELRALGARYPDRRPGGAGDRALAAHIAATLKGLGGTAGGGFSGRTATPPPAARSPSSLGPRRCSSWPACSPRARPSARSSSSRPAAAAAAT